AILENRSHPSNNTMPARGLSSRSGHRTAIVAATAPYGSVAVAVCIDYELLTPASIDHRGTPPLLPLPEKESRYASQCSVMTITASSRLPSETTQHEGGSRFSARPRGFIEAVESSYRACGRRLVSAWPACIRYLLSQNREREFAIG